ncbi:hypothetical protein ABZ746_17055 [Streptomyces sp. NPDC020096]
MISAVLLFASNAVTSAGSDVPLAALLHDPGQHLVHHFSLVQSEPLRFITAYDLAFPLHGEWLALVALIVHAVPSWTGYSHVSSTKLLRIHCATALPLTITAQRGQATQDTESPVGRPTPAGWEMLTRVAVTYLISPGMRSLWMPRLTREELNAMVLDEAVAFYWHVSLRAARRYLAVHATRHPLTAKPQLALILICLVPAFSRLQMKRFCTASGV